MFWSCKKYLDYNENTFYNSDDVFHSFGRTKAFLTNIYSYLPTGFMPIDGAMRSSATDDAIHVYDLSQINRFNNGSWSALQVVDDQWGKMYSGIRAANIFLDQAKLSNFSDIVYNSDYPQTVIQFNYYPYEARFLRAFFYFELVKRYGDVPLITTVLTEADANNEKRAPFDEVVAFIVSECDAVAAKLPDSFSPVTGGETGRATKWAALALKARVLLYAASPLHNVSSDQAKWITAATAAKAIIDGGKFSLEASYKNIVNNITSREVIFDIRQAASNTFEAANFPIGFEGGNTGTCPSENLVESYEMQATGLGINEAASGYVATDPYTGRDPRFYETILYNNAVWKTLNIESWNGGLNGPPKDRATKTGYYLKKYVIEAVSLSPVTPSARIHDWVLFRYGEVLLNYAEAMNEVYGPYTAGTGTNTMTANDAVNLVRTRAGMPVFPAGLTTQDYTAKLRNERRVELAFEDQRFWDIRRWRIGNSTKDIYGVDVAKDANGAITYTKKLVETRIWDDKMNLFPIQQNELALNKAISQNPGW